MRKERGAYLAAFLLLLAAEFAIALFVRDRFVRPYVGDVLAVLLVYALARVLWTRPTWWLPGAAFALGAAVETAQYFRLAERLHVEQIALLRVALGSTFDWADLICYAVGGVIALIWQRVERRRKRWE